MSCAIWNVWDSYGPVQRLVLRDFADKLAAVFYRYNHRNAATFRDSIVWLELALDLSGHGTDAEEYMELQFRHDPSPSSRSICSAAAIEAYHRYIKDHDVQFRSDQVVIYQLKDVENMMGEETSLREVLLKATHLNPLVAYCLAVAAGDMDIATQFEQEAAIFLRIHPTYRSALGTLFSEPQYVQPIPWYEDKAKLRSLERRVLC